MTIKKQKKTALNVRVDLHLLNKLEFKAIQKNTTLSNVVREIFEKS
jgi:molybdenum cofactor biosynthesis enzyme MoaA